MKIIENAVAKENEKKKKNTVNVRKHLTGKVNQIHVLLAHHLRFFRRRRY